MTRTLLATITGATDAECFTCSHAEVEVDESVRCAMFCKEMPDRYRLPECIEAEQRASKMRQALRNILALALKLSLRDGVADSISHLIRICREGGVGSSVLREMDEAEP